MVFLYQQELLPPTSVNACIWASIQHEEVLVVAKGSILTVYHLNDDNTLVVAASLHMGATIGDVGRIASPWQDDLVAICFDINLKLSVCRVDVENEVAEPVLMYDFSEVSHKPVKLSDFCFHGSCCSLTMRTTTQFIAVIAGRKLAVSRLDLRNVNRDADPGSAFVSIDYPATMVISDFTVVQDDMRVVLRRCSVIAAFKNVAQSSLLSETIMCFDVDAVNSTVVTLWATDVPGTCLKLLAQDLLRVVVMSCHKLTVLQKAGRVSNSVKLNCLADLESNSTEIGLDIELDAFVQATAIADSLLMIFASYTVWLFDMASKAFRPVARMASEYVSAPAANRARNLIFLGSRTHDALLVEFKFYSCSPPIAQDDSVLLYGVNARCGQDPVLKERRLRLNVCDSISALGAIVDAAFSVKCQHVSERKHSPRVDRRASELLVCCASGVLACLSSIVHGVTLARIQQVARAVAAGKALMIQTHQNTLRKFGFVSGELQEEECLGVCCGRLLCAGDAVVVCEKSVSGAKFKSASACGGVVIAVTTRGFLYEIHPCFQRRSSHLFDAASLAYVPLEFFSSNANLKREFNDSADNTLCGLQLPDHTEIANATNAKGCEQECTRSLTQIVCVCASISGHIMVYNTLRWDLIYCSTASLCNRPRWLRESEVSRGGGAKTTDVRLHWLSSGGRGVWCFVILIDQFLHVFRSRSKDFRRVDCNVVKGSRLVPFSNIESRSGVFISGSTSTAVLLAERGGFHILRTSHDVTFCVGSLYGWLMDGVLNLGCSFGNIVLLGGQLVVRKMRLGPTVIKGHKVVVCSTGDSPLFAVLVETMHANENLEQGSVILPPTAGEGLPLTAGIQCQLMQQARSRYEVRVVSASSHVRQACVLLNYESGITMCRLAINSTSYVCVGTHKLAKQEVFEDKRSRGRLLIFQVEAQRLRLVIVREMQGVVTCIRQLGDDCVVVGAGTKLEIHRLCPAEPDRPLTLRQVAHHHGCGPYISQLACLKQYVLYSSPHGSRLLFWRSKDKLVAEIGRHEITNAIFGLIINQSQVTVFACSSTEANILSGTSLLQKQRTLSTLPGHAVQLSAPISSCMSHPISNHSWALTLCSVDGTVAVISAVSERAYRMLSALERSISSGSDKRPELAILNGRSLASTFTSLSAANQLHLASAISSFTSMWSPGLLSSCHLNLQNMQQKAGKCALRHEGFVDALKEVPWGARDIVSQLNEAFHFVQMRALFF